MIVVVDTNVLGRLSEPGHAQYKVAHDAIESLRRGGNVPCVVPQVLYEFWVVATRPVAQNGLGLNSIQAEGELVRIESLLPLLPETASVYAEWRLLVIAHQVTGKNAHVARIVALMMVHGISRILTFNTRDFARYPGITAIDPATVALPSTP
jgi:predicted nucleic acid-binding protein